jgi:hypothetical protein
MVIVGIMAITVTATVELGFLFLQWLPSGERGIANDCPSEGKHYR